MPRSYVANKDNCFVIGSLFCALSCRDISLSCVCSSADVLLEILPRIEESCESASMGTDSVEITGLSDP